MDQAIIRRTLSMLRSDEETRTLNKEAGKKGVFLRWLKTALMIAGKMAVITAAAICMWKGLTPYFRLERTYEGDWFRNLPAHKVDVLALGSSHVQYAFNPANFYAETGWYSYVLGSSCQPFSESYYMLKEALVTQHPSVVILDVFTLLPQSQVCYADGTYYLAMDMMSEPTRTEAAGGLPEDMDPDTKLSYTYDFYMNHDNWKNMNLSDLASVIRNAEPKEGYSWDMGYVRQQPEHPAYTPLQRFSVKEKVELSESEKTWIDRMIDLCEKEQIHLLFIKSPYLENQKDADKLAAVWEYLDSRNMPYIDFIEKAQELEWFLDMDGDTWHNNTWGAEIVTRYLADYVRKNQWVQQHSEDEMMDTLMHTGMKKSAEDLLNARNVNIYRLMEEGAKYPCTILFRYKGYEDSSIGDYENKALRALGLSHDFQNDRESDYYAIVRDGKLIQDGSEPFETVLDGKKITFLEDDIRIDNASVGTPGELMIVFVDDAWSWINPLGIDYSTRWFWKNGCDGWNCTASAVSEE